MLTTSTLFSYTPQTDTREDEDGADDQEGSYSRGSSDDARYVGTARLCCFFSARSGSCWIEVDSRVGAGLLRQLLLWTADGHYTFWCAVAGNPQTVGALVLSGDEGVLGTNQPCLLQLGSRKIEPDRSLKVRLYFAPLRHLRSFGEH